MDRRSFFGRAAGWLLGLFGIAAFTKPDDPIIYPRGLMVEVHMSGDPLFRHEGASLYLPDDGAGIILPPNNTGKPRYYRARHVKHGYDDGRWSYRETQPSAS